MGEQNEGERGIMLICLSLIDSEEDKSKFEQLYLSYRQLMHHVALGILKDHHKAKDAVHEAFIPIEKIFLRFPRFLVPRQKVL